MQSTCLYRYFDSEGQLLYIGITQNQGIRLQQHFASSLWFKLVSSAAIEHYDTRQEAIAAERDAILTELPIYNVVHNPRRETWRSHFQRLFDISDDLRDRDTFHAQLIEAIGLSEWPTKARAKNEYRHAWAFTEAINEICGVNEDLGPIPCPLCAKIYELPQVDYWLNKAWETIDAWIYEGQPE